MDRIIFTLKPHSIIDVITNSSSELFVGKSQNKEEIESLIKEAYPDYLNEYAELKKIDEISTDDLDTYFDYKCSAHVWPAKKEDFPVINGFTFDELYIEEKEAWNGKMQYKLRTNDSYNFVTDNNKDEIINKLDPNKEMYFLFSLDENPNWDMQEKLELFMDRLHLG